MKPYSHHYAASASARAADNVMISAPDLPPIRTAAPPEFDGPGDGWSPEMLLCAAIADCFVLTFRAVARAAHFDWFSLDCRVEGVLEHVGDTAQFTSFVTTARLTIPQGADTSNARRLLNRAKYGCLIANSLRGVQTLCAEVVVADDTPGPQASRAECGDKGIGLRATPQEQQYRGRAAAMKRLAVLTSGGDARSHRPTASDGVRARAGVPRRGDGARLRLSRAHGGDRRRSGNHRADAGTMSRRNVHLRKYGVYTRVSNHALERSLHT